MPVVFPLEDGFRCTRDVFAECCTDRNDGDRSVISVENGAGAAASGECSMYDVKGTVASLGENLEGKMAEGFRTQGIQKRRKTTRISR